MNLVPGPLKDRVNSTGPKVWTVHVKLVPSLKPIILQIVSGSRDWFSMVV